MVAQKLRVPSISGIPYGCPKQTSELKNKHLESTPCFLCFLSKTQVNTTFAYFYFKGITHYSVIPLNYAKQLTSTDTSQARS